MKKFLRTILIIFILLYVFSGLFREIINYINPLSKPIVALIAKNYVEKEYNIDVNIDNVVAYFPEPSGFSVYFTVKEEPYIKFSYGTNLSLNTSGDTYYDGVFDYVFKRDIDDIIKNTFGEDLINYEQESFVTVNKEKKSDINLRKNISDLTISDFKNYVRSASIDINLKGDKIDIYNFSEFYNLIKIYKSFPDKYKYISVYFKDNAGTVKSDFTINVYKDKIESQQDLINLFNDRLLEQSVKNVQNKTNN